MNACVYKMSIMSRLINQPVLVFVVNMNPQRTFNRSITAVVMFSNMTTPFVSIYQLINNN